MGPYGRASWLALRILRDKPQIKVKSSATVLFECRPIYLSVKVGQNLLDEKVI
jgi:hypothetical protein